MAEFVALSIVYTAVLLIWTLINNHSSRAMTKDLRDIQKEYDDKQKEFKKIVSIDVIMEDGSRTLSFSAAKEYFLGDRYLEILNDEGKPVAHLERRTIFAMFINREGDRE